MRENDELNRINNENDNAQAVKESELSAVYDAMDYAGDIQPLDDIEIPKEIKTNYDHLKAESRSFEKSKDCKNRKIPGFSGLNKRVRYIIVTVIVLIGLAGVSVGGYFILEGRNTNNSPVDKVYNSGSGEATVLLKNGKTFSFSGAQEIHVSNDGMYIYYSKNTSSKTGKYDIRLIDISKKNSIEKDGFFINNGVNDDWQINTDGSYMCYSRTQSGLTEYLMYSTESGKSVTITNNMENLLMPSSGDVVYFTRVSGSTRSLHRMRYGEDSQNVVSGIEYADIYDSGNGFEVLYTVKTGEENKIDVYSVKAYEKPVSICSDVSEIYLNDYVYSGNLYYFTKNSSNVNWQDFITDSHYDSDRSMTKPVEGDYMIEKGFIFKRYVLDEYAYNSAVSAYKAKLSRDEIRSELDKLDLGLAVKDEYTCYVYDGTTSRKLATGVVLDNILAYAKTDSPRIIFRKAVIDAGSSITMDKLIELSSSKSVSQAMDYVRSKVGGSYTVSNDCLYSWFDGNKVLEYTVSGYNLKNTEFILGSRNAMFAITGGNLYCNRITESALGEKELIDKNVSDYEMNGNYLYYNTNQSESEQTLCRYSVDSSKQTICANVYSYFPIEDDYVIVLSKQASDGELMTIGIFNTGKYIAVDTDADLNGFVFNARSFSYIKNVGKTTGSSSEGEIYGYTLEKGVKLCGQNAAKIIYTNK